MSGQLITCPAWSTWGVCAIAIAGWCRVFRAVRGWSWSELSPANDWTGRSQERGGARGEAESRRGVRERRSQGRRVQGRGGVREAESGEVESGRGGVGEAESGKGRGQGGRVRGGAESGEAESGEAESGLCVVSDRSWLQSSQFSTKPNGQSPLWSARSSPDRVSTGNVDRGPVGLGVVGGGVGNGLWSYGIWRA